MTIYPTREANRLYQEGRLRVRLTCKIDGPTPYLPGALVPAGLLPNTVASMLNAGYLQPDDRPLPGGAEPEPPKQSIKPIFPTRSK